MPANHGNCLATLIVRVFAHLQNRHKEALKHADLDLLPCGHGVDADDSDSYIMLWGSNCCMNTV
jgi:hypothetical protein